VISAFGPQSNIAAVVNQFCRAMGCSSGGGLSSSDQSSVVKLQRWAKGASGRRLGLRFETAGVHIDWQPPREGIHTGPFSSITAAVNNFCRHPRSGGCN
jgi:hypothetical protein